MLHEWIHMSWGSAEVCPGGGKYTVLCHAIMHYIQEIKEYQPLIISCTSGPTRRKAKRTNQDGQSC